MPCNKHVSLLFLFVLLNVSLAKRTTASITFESESVIKEFQITLTKKVKRVVGVHGSYDIQFTHKMIDATLNPDRPVATERDGTLVEITVKGKKLCVASAFGRSITGEELTVDVENCTHLKFALPEAEPLDACIVVNGHLPCLCSAPGPIGSPAGCITPQTDSSSTTETDELPACIVVNGDLPCLCSAPGPIGSP
eukprot:UN29580